MYVVIDSYQRSGEGSFTLEWDYYDAFVHRWMLEIDGTDSGTGDNLVDVTLRGDARFLDGGGASLDGYGDYLDLGDEFAFAARTGSRGVPGCATTSKCGTSRTCCPSAIAERGTGST